MAILTVKGKTLADNYQVSLSTNNHTFISDATAADGGNTTYASPKDLFLSAVAACKLMTMKIFVDRKDWQVDDIEIKMDFDPVNLENLVIRQEINITSKTLTAKQIERIKSIAELCPVANYMKKNITFKTTNNI